MKVAENKSLIIPVEIKARELNAKLLLAVKALKKGYEVYLGRSGEITMLSKYLRPSIFIEKDIASVRKSQFKSLKDVGHKIVAWDEEGVVEVNYDWYTRIRINEACLEQVEKFFSWGKFQTAAIENKYPNQKEKLITSGNPRIDILSSSFDPLLSSTSNKLKAKYGDYILINTNFGGANIFNNDSEEFIGLIAKRLNLSKDESEFFRGFILYSAELLEYFKDLIPKLAKEFPNVQFILRPHPSENHDYWKEYLKDFDNVHVIFEGTAVEAIKAANLLIHNGCTTGVEAAIMRCPTIAYTPIHSKKFDLYLPNNVSVKALSVADVIDKIKLLKKDAKKFTAIQESNLLELSDHIASLDKMNSCEVILNELDKIFIENKKKPFSRNMIFFRIRAFIIGIYNSLHELKSFIGNRKKFHLRPHLYREGDINEIRKIISDLRKIDETIPPLKVTKVFRFCYKIEVL